MTRHFSPFNVGFDKPPFRRWRIKYSCGFQEIPGKAGARMLVGNVCWSGMHARDTPAHMDA